MNLRELEMWLLRVRDGEMRINLRSESGKLLAGLVAKTMRMHWNVGKVTGEALREFQSAISTESELVDIKLEVTDE